MTAHVIPVDKLDPETLERVIEEFISRSGTDYGEREASLESNVKEVKQKLERGTAVLVFDDESETTAILSSDNPTVKKLIP